MTVHFDAHHDFGLRADNGFPAALVNRAIAAAQKLVARPWDEGVRAEAVACGTEMWRHQSGHSAHAAMKAALARPARLGFADFAKGAGGVDNPLSGGLATDADREHVCLMAPDWIAVGSRWTLAANAPDVAGGAQLVVMVGADRTAVVPAGLAIGLLATWASARAEPGGAGTTYRVTDSIRGARAADAGVFAQDDRRKGADQREGRNVRDGRPAARVPSSADRRPGGDPYGQDHSR